MLTQSLKQTYTIRPASYAKGKLAIHCKPDGSGYKTLAGLIISRMKGVRYSNRESSYIVSPRCAAKFEAELERIEQKQKARQLIEEAHSTGRAVDYIDGNPANNDPANPRIVTLTGEL